MRDTSGEQLGSGSQINGKQQLDSWKEIAAYVHRTVATVKRWEKKEGLPVHRHLHDKRSTVYAYPSEIDAWVGSRSVTSEPGWFRFFSENNKTVVGMVGGVTLVLLVGLVAWMVIGSSSNPEGLDFQQRDWVLITDFENRTGEAVFDGVLEYALEREIANSQFVNVVPRERIEDTLQLMRKPLDTPIDSEVAREVYLRDGGIKALLTGRVEKLDSTYLLSVQVVDPSQGQVVATASEEAVGQEQVLSALRSLSNWSRETLGEALVLIQQSNEKLEKVSTPSLRALQLFTKAEALISQGRDDVAEELLKRAVAIDPEFASAHIFLAHAIRDQRAPRTLKPAEDRVDEYMKHAERAFQLAGTTSDRERYFIHGSYSAMKGEPEKAIHAFETLLSLYPDHFWAVNNLADQFNRVGQEQRALAYDVRRADLRPSSFRYTTQASYQLLLHGDLARAKTYWGRALDLMTPEEFEQNPTPAIRLLWLPAFEALLHADPETALRESYRLLERLTSSEQRGYFNYEPTGAFYLTLGKIGLAREWLEESDNGGSRRHYFLAAIAYVEEDHEAMTEHLKQLLKAWESQEDTEGPVRARNVVLLLVRGGLLLEAEELFSSWSRPVRGEAMERRRDILGGVLALSRGNRIEGMRMLESALSSIGPWDRAAAPYFMGSELLAKAWREQRNSGKAVQVLKTALEEKSRLLLEQSLLTVPIWLRLQAQLAQLYSEMGRDADALKIEDELRKRLALADPDHPILRQLNSTEELALLEPTN